jgi:hypothetical protein
MKSLFAAYFLSAMLYLIFLYGDDNSPIENQHFLMIERKEILNSLHDQTDSLLLIGLGAFNTTRSQQYPDIQLDYRTTWKFLEGKILFGGMITSQASTFIYTGITWDIFFGVTRFILIPSFCPGIYLEGKGINLGFPLEFRSSIGFGYEFKNKNRLAFHYYHISNCHLGSRNPGVEGITLSYGFPFNR